MRYYSPEAVSDERNYFELFQIYRTAAKSCGVIRSGSGLYGAPYDYRQAVNDARSGRRGESVAEHAYLSTVKLIGLYERFPRYRPRDPYGNEDPFLFLNQISLTMFHDLAENETGDIPDDGRRDQQEKAIVEKRFMREFACHFPTDSGETLISLFGRFDDALDASTIPRVAEKSEALSRATLYEANGSIGYLSYKEEYYSSITDQDANAAKATNSEHQLDIWTFRFIQQFRGKPSFKEFFGEVLVGTMTARNGEVFPWCEDDLLRPYDLKKLRRIVDGSDEE